MPLIGVLLGERIKSVFISVVEYDQVHLHKQIFRYFEHLYCFVLLMFPLHFVLEANILLCSHKDLFDNFNFLSDFMVHQSLANNLSTPNAYNYVKNIEIYGSFSFTIDTSVYVLSEYY